MLPSTYRKLVIARHAKSVADAVEMVECPMDHPSKGEVLIRNRYAGVNGVADLHLAMGQLEARTHEPPFDFGFESVGEIVAVGEDVDNFRVGDAVASSRFGHGYRQYHVMDAASVIPIKQPSPEMVTLFPTGVSALLALEVAGQLTKEELVFVSAAAGGLGHIAVQVALSAGNRVVALCGSEQKVQRVAALGCERVINYKQENLDQVLSTDYPNGFNLILDTVGGEIFDTLVKHLAVRGRLVVSGFTSDAHHPKPVTRPRIYTDLYWKAASIRAFINPMFREHHPEARRRLLDMYEDGKIEVWYQQPLFGGLARLPDAVDCLLSGSNTGKVVLGID